MYFLFLTFTQLYILCLKVLTFGSLKLSANEDAITLIGIVPAISSDVIFRLSVMLLLSPNFPLLCLCFLACCCCRYFSPHLPLASIGRYLYVSDEPIISKMVVFVSAKIKTLEFLNIIY